VKIDSETIDAPKSSANQEDGPINENSRQIMSSPSAQRHNSKRRKPRIPLANLDEHLLKAYLSPSKPGETPPLQLRRTLDQYYYTHLVSTAGRDGDQVVLRYTRKNSLEPKIFMVDQLRLWILNDGKQLFLFCSLESIGLNWLLFCNENKPNPQIYSAAPAT